jgi:hypothetical protein
MSWGQGDYSGEIRDGKPHGKGNMKYPNGQYFTGQWVRGKRHGGGVLTDGAKILFDGTWKNDKKGDGNGLIEHINATYTGHIFNGLPSGKGLM